MNREEEYKIGRGGGRMNEMRMGRGIRREEQEERKRNEEGEEEEIDEEGEEYSVYNNIII